MKAIEIQSPNLLSRKDNYVTVFLGGSIEMDLAEPWQQKLVTAMKETSCIFYNPRRDDWDSTWKQDISDPNFNAQVTWELKALDLADVIVMYFDPTTKSPISLLELGLYAKSKKVIVCCPDGYWRKGNVDIVCQRFGVRNVPTFEELMSLLKSVVA